MITRRQKEEPLKNSCFSIEAWLNQTSLKFSIGEKPEFKSDFGKTKIQRAINS